VGLGGRAARWAIGDGWRAGSDPARRVRGHDLAAECGSEARLRALERALGLSRGPAFDEFAHEVWAAGAAARLDELHAAATEDHAEALVDAHRWSAAIAELSDHIARHPLRDRPRGLLMRALAGDGRQADALRTYREYRHLLAEEVGTEPSAAVQLVGRRIADGWTGTSTDGEPGPLRGAGLDAYRGRLGAIGIGIHVRSAVDRLLAGLAALEGHDDVAEELVAAALELERALGSTPPPARTAQWSASATAKRRRRARR
jgi:hypothetical protein